MCVSASVAKKKKKKKKGTVLKFHKLICHQKIVDPYFCKSKSSPFVELCPFERVIMKFCNQDTAKSVTARSLKRSQQVD